MEGKYYLYQIFTCRIVFMYKICRSYTILWKFSIIHISGILGVNVFAVLRNLRSNFLDLDIPLNKCNFSMRLRQKIFFSFPIVNFFAYIFQLVHFPRICNNMFDLNDRNLVIKKRVRRQVFYFYFQSMFCCK
jgi:hypothetical protein